jgi:hypothetical protein
MSKYWFSRLHEHDSALEQTIMLRRALSCGAFVSPDIRARERGELDSDVLKEMGVNKRVGGSAKSMDVGPSEKVSNAASGPNAPFHMRNSLTNPIN